jgi:hypothetical protein
LWELDPENKINEHKADIQDREKGYTCGYNIEPLNKFDKNDPSMPKYIRDCFSDNNTI